MDWTREFPGLAKSTYLNSCAHGLLPRRTRAALERHLQAWEDGPDWGAWLEAVEDARRGFARLVGAREDEIAIQSNASAGAAAVMGALGAGARREILTVDLDFPAAPFVAERQRARGLRHVHLRAQGRAMEAGEWARALGAETALACVPAVASFTGYRLDAKAFVERAHARGVPVLLDAFQAAGTFPIDVKALDVDFLVSGVYKWLMAPAGLAFLYVRRDHHGLVPTTSGWYAAEDPYGFDPLGPLASDARRFQQGGASVVGCAAAAESIRLLEEVGVAEVERRSRALVDRVLDGARLRKWEVLTPEDPARRASIVTFRVPDLARALESCRRARVAVNPRLGGVRVSPHFYNREEDVDRLFEALDAAA